MAAFDFDRLRSASERKRMASQLELFSVDCNMQNNMCTYRGIKAHFGFDHSSASNRRRVASQNGLLSDYINMVTSKFQKLCQIIRTIIR